MTDHDPTPKEAPLFTPVTHCWCGARGASDSPFSAAYFACGRCGTHFSKQRLRSAAAVAEFYTLGGYWQARQERKGHPALEARPEIIANSGRVDKWLETLHRHRPAAPVPGGDGGTPPLVVEVGCAEAVFLQRLAAEGWRCRGLEPDAATARLVAERTGLDIRGGVFPEAAAEAAGCDLFIACDVLEHSPDPVRFLSAAHAALRPGGTLFLQMPMLEWDPATPFGYIEAGVFDAQEHAFIFSRAALQGLLEAVRFEVLENADAWIRGHELVVARKPTPGAVPGRATLPSATLSRVRRLARGYDAEPSFGGPLRACGRLGDVEELADAEFTDFMDELNAFAVPLGLQTFTNLSKVWEYPWLWRHGLRHVHWPGVRLADLGSELSPLPWWLATLGARVHLVEVHGRLSEHWAWLRDHLGVSVDWTVVDPQDSRLPFDDDSLDVLTSFSVLEHQADQAGAVDEAARVLRPGGMLATSFDLCEPDRGMSFPAWNGQALTMAEFERLVWQHPAFAPGSASPAWNLGSIDPFLRWHGQSAPHHRYVVGAAVLWKRR